ncbi:esterase [Oscillatoria sp. CS-180]|uniref:YqiA/YcfP family alpha/beta fold hydrolase n=1 Tax=Oscillatoria sp. CS-180 TaxID=3021720 RepID=UPI00232CCE59|nr:YqiA/YcfP family alpha/beta fold hydrolase [Oscillatoria sp. CS-180]MDB9528442.1 esterase [Oscillatoria sp. CS-180]
MNYLYLHGFASSPQSSKAQFLKRQLAAVGKTLHILDLNQDDFSHLTLTRQINQSVGWMQLQNERQEQPQPFTIMGSSLGGLTATWIAQQPTVQPHIKQLVLLAPAFQFLNQWLPRLGAESIAHWQQTGWLSVYHYGLAQQVPLAYDFVVDAETYDERQLDAPIPTLILHGQQDEVIDLQASRDYASSRPWVTLVELDSDHSLGSVQPKLWEEMRSFLNIGMQLWNQKT